jgi:hypothetical protein
MNNRFWERTLENLARHVGVTEPAVETKVVCIDRHRQWRQARNVRHSATFRTMRLTLTAPIRKLTSRR